MSKTYEELLHDAFCKCMQENHGKDWVDRYNPEEQENMRREFCSGAEWQAKQSPWIKAKNQLPFVDEDDISEQSEPVLVIVSAKGHYEPEILVYNKYYHVWDTADADDYCCDVSDNDLWMPIPGYNENK